MFMATWKLLGWGREWHKSHQTLAGQGLHCKDGCYVTEVTLKIWCHLVPLKVTK